jgi:hypothetical protein
MSDQVSGDALYVGTDWKARYQRTERLPDTGLLVRVALIVHRRHPEQSVLTTECFCQADGGEETVSLGGSALELRGATAVQGRRHPHRSVGRSPRRRDVVAEPLVAPARRCPAPPRSRRPIRSSASPFCEGLRALGCRRSYSHRQQAAHPRPVT